MLSPEAVTPRRSVKKMFLKIQQNSLENTSVRINFLIKLQALGVSPVYNKIKIRYTRNLKKVKNYINVTKTYIQTDKNFCKLIQPFPTNKGFFQKSEIKSFPKKIKQ